MRVLQVPPELDGTRLDRFVQSQLRNTSRTRSQRIIDRSAFAADGRPLRKNHRLGAAELVVLWRPPWDEHVPALALEAVYRDEHLLAINKPPLVAVHPTARHHRGTVIMLAHEQWPGERLALLHRLDRETSGVLMMARTRAADRGVKLQFEARQGVVKRYQAIVWGWPEWERRDCELPLEPDPDSRYRVKMRPARPGWGRASATAFEVLGRRRSTERGRRYALLECTMYTGRQHQIRVHCAALGLPIVGDKLYGPDEQLFARGADQELSEQDRAVLELDRHALHAAALEIDHPADGRRLHIEAPLYPDLAAFWQGLGPA